MPKIPKLQLSGGFNISAQHPTYLAIISTKANLRLSVKFL
jgi:hypothetical protein